LLPPAPPPPPSGDLNTPPPIPKGANKPGAGAPPPVPGGGGVEPLAASEYEQPPEKKMTAAERMAQDPRYKNSLLNALTQPKQDASQEQAAAPGAALTVPKADDGDMYGGKALFSKPTWRERKTKVVEAG